MKKKINKIFDIADINLPSLRAYTVHVMKMADNFCHFSNQVELLIHYKKFNYNYHNIKKDFLLLAKNLFFIKGFFLFIKFTMLWVESISEAVRSNLFYTFWPLESVHLFS